MEYEVIIECKDELDAIKLAMVSEQWCWNNHISFIESEKTLDSNVHFIFFDEEDAVAFKLRWL